MLVFGKERVKGTPEDLDEISQWKYQRWKLAQLYPAFKPSDFDAMGDAPWWIGWVDLSRHELTDCVGVLNAQAKAKRKPKEKGS